MGRLEDINILWCSKKWDLEKLCSLIRVESYLLGVGSARKNEICSEVGFVGVGRGEGESWRKYLSDCPKKLRLGRDSLFRCGKRRGRVGLSLTQRGRRVQRVLESRRNCGSFPNHTRAHECFIVHTA